MSRVYIIASPDDREIAEELVEYLKVRGSLVRLELGERLYPMQMPGEKTIALWSLRVRMSAKQIMFTNRAIDALVGDGLVLVKLDHHQVPRGLSDVETIDMHFAPARQMKFQQITQALDAIDVSKREEASAPPPSKPGGGFFGKTMGDLDRYKSASPPSAALEGLASEEIVSAPAPSEKATQNIFISYAVRNADTVYPLVDSIASLGHEIWIDKQKLKGGDNWAGSIVRGLKAADKFCLMCSAEAFDSDNVRREVYLADKYKKPMLPVKLDDAMMPEDIEFFLIDRQYIDLTELDAPKRAEKLKSIFQS